MKRVLSESISSHLERDQLREILTQPIAKRSRRIREIGEVLYRYQSTVSGSNFPASVDAIEALPTTIIMKDSKYLNETCPLCLEQLKPGDPVIVLPCGHVFHETSVRSPQSGQNLCLGISYWFLSNRSCPQCRVIVDKTTPELNKSEKLLVPFIIRLVKALREQTDLLNSILDKSLSTGENSSNFKQSYICDILKYGSENDEEILDVPDKFEYCWQKLNARAPIRIVMVQKIQMILICHLSCETLLGMNFNQGLRVISLARKIELSLFAEASTIEEYSAIRTLISRTRAKLIGFSFANQHILQH